MFDIIIEGGSIYDGSGAAEFIGDLGLKDGRIATIGDLEGVAAKDRVDASGLAVTPGFIDLHTHSDFTLLVNGRAESQVHQGVTTETIGQCGASCAPVNCDRDIESLAVGFKEGCHHLGWRTFGEYLDALDAIALGVNVVSFVGHGAIHRAVLGDTLRAGDQEEVANMTHLVEEAFDQGASGFSSGLEYWPGIMASPEHLVPMCEVAASHGALYATHVRNRDTYYDLGFGEAMATARNSGVRLQISHIQPKFGAPDFAMEHTLEMIENARRHDVDVAFDIIPHDWSHTRVMAILPKWACEGGIDAISKRLRDPAQRARIKNNPQPMWLLVKARRWSDIVLLDSEVNADLIGANFEEIGRIRGIDPYDAVFDLLLEEGENMVRMFWTSHSFKDDDIRLCLEQPECAVISDTTALAPYGELKDHIGSLSGYGWAARFLQNYVRDQKVISIAQGIRRITSLPAERLGLKDRGALRPGFNADISIFDPLNIASHCDVKNPRVYATGIAHVLVNGQFAMRDGKRTEIDSGTVIRGSNIH